ncbi:Arc family DNA-binding protein [Paraburkholderia madseniana]|uniref:Arc family DNA-binding protein n=1 Tax=Paraburkholderia madseniana TaxID=2599607 RepID=UPI0038BA5A72
MARDEPQINLRMPADLKARLEQAASENRRSTTAEIMARLEESFASEKSGSTPTIDDRTLDLFADTVAGKVVRALDEREKKRAKR